MAATGYGHGIVAMAALGYSGPQSFHIDTSLAFTVAHAYIPTVQFFSAHIVHLFVTFLLANAYLIAWRIYIFDFHVIRNFWSYFAFCA